MPYPNTPVSQLQDDGFAQVAVPIDQSKAPILRFVKGDYLLGVEKEIIAPGTVVVVLRTADGWVRLVKGEPAKHILRERGVPFPKRDDPRLGDLDKKEWPIFDGQPSDPWCLEKAASFREHETGRLMIFSTQSFTGMQAVEQLARNVVLRRKAVGAPVLPVVELAVGKWMSGRGPVATPVLKIIDWIDGPDEVPVAVTPLEIEEEESASEELPQPRRREQQQEARPSEIRPSLRQYRNPIDPSDGDDAGPAPRQPLRNRVLPADDDLPDDPLPER